MIGYLQLNTSALSYQLIRFRVFGSWYTKSASTKESYSELRGRGFWEICVLMVTFFYFQHDIMMQRRRNGVKPEMPSAEERRKMLESMGKPYWLETCIDWLFHCTYEDLSAASYPSMNGTSQLLYIGLN